MKVLVVMLIFWSWHCFSFLNMNDVAVWLCYEICLAHMILIIRWCNTKAYLWFNWTRAWSWRMYQSYFTCCRKDLYIRCRTATRNGYMLYYNWTNFFFTVLFVLFFCVTSNSNNRIKAFSFKTLPLVLALLLSSEKIRWNFVAHRTVFMHIRWWFLELPAVYELTFYHPLSRACPDVFCIIRTLIRVWSWGLGMVEVESKE